MDSFRLLLSVIICSTHLVKSLIVVEAKDENKVANSINNTTSQTNTTTNALDMDYDGCQIDEFECSAGECIKLTLLCDDMEDCGDGRDEFNCTDYTDYDYECYEHQCSDGTCLGLNLICDGRDDCDDGSDETNCTGQNATCAENLFACADKVSCVPTNFVCNGNIDCTDGSDEDNCVVPTVSMVTTTEFDYYGGGGGDDCLEYTCGDGLCYFADMVCDGFEQCSDGIDEANCPDTSPSIITTKSSFSSTVRGSITASPFQATTRSSSNCGAEQFQCNNGVCINATLSCNGHDDCGDNTDEASCAGTATATITKGGLQPCNHQGVTYPPGSDFLTDECGGMRCEIDSNGETRVIVWTEAGCSALTSKVNLLALGLSIIFGYLTSWS